MKRTRIQSITSELLGKTITICGWVRTVRDQKNFAFVEINDGSTLAGFQIIMEGDTKDLTTGRFRASEGNSPSKAPAENRSWSLKRPTLKF